MLHPLPEPEQSIHPATEPGEVTLAVANLARSVDFYTRVLGMQTIERSGAHAVMGADGVPIIVLDELPGAVPQPEYSTGLYHVAVLLPTRADLAHFLIHLGQSHYPLAGYADHLVSEALYLSDIDGNGLEVYADRPRETWQHQGDMVVMDSLPIDFDNLLAEVPDQDAPWPGMPEGTKVGHIHLRIGNIQQGADFYHKLLGFDIMAQIRGALFVSAGGYHHHIGLNIWQSRGASPPPANAVGMREFKIVVPEADALTPVLNRLDNAGEKYQRESNTVKLSDPWQNHIVLTVGDGA
jgi:catechol 2,3-dioxygenase